MQGYSPKLPLVLDPIDGPYRLTRSVKEVVAQNLKMLVLTSPGERVMEPNFGVGLYNFLFELNTQHTQTSISGKIRQQVKRYMPFIGKMKIQFGEPDELEMDRNSLVVVLTYAIPSLGDTDILTVSIDR
tara:strand:+ start:217 stop:603 length:387 start_codon:yes stop_codon:yes gene_type:complete